MHAAKVADNATRGYLLDCLPLLVRLFPLSRAFSGTVISHDVFVVLDVMWLAGVLKPVLDHRGVAKNKMGDQVREGHAAVVPNSVLLLPRQRERERAAQLD